MKPRLIAIGIGLGIASIVVAVALVALNLFWQLPVHQSDVIGVYVGQL